MRQGFEAGSKWNSNSSCSQQQILLLFGFASLYRERSHCFSPGFQTSNATALYCLDSKGIRMEISYEVQGHLVSDFKLGRKMKNTATSGLSSILIFLD